MPRALNLFVFAMLAASQAAAAPQVIAAQGRWATLQEGTTCQAASRSLTEVPKDAPQPRASISFDANGQRRGQLAIQLSRPARDGSPVLLHLGDTPYLLVGRGGMAWSRGPAQEEAIIAAMRREGGFRIEARSASGARIVNRYSLDGAPLAIDAAAACAARLANR